VQDFYFCYIFKTNYQKNFLATRKFGGRKKLWGGTAPECTRGYGPVP